MHFKHSMYIAFAVGVLASCSTQLPTVPVALEPEEGDETELTAIVRSIQAQPLEIRDRARGLTDSEHPHWFRKELRLRTPVQVYQIALDGETDYRVIARGRLVDGINSAIFVPEIRVFGPAVSTIDDYELTGRPIPPRFLQGLKYRTEFTFVTTEPGIYYVALFANLADQPIQLRTTNQYGAVMSVSHFARYPYGEYDIRVR